MAGSILGNRVLRKEDPRFLTTGGVYVDDLLTEPMLVGAAHVTYVRSTVAHGLINSVDTTDALAMPGVIAIYTAADLELQPVASPFNPMVTRGLLAIDKVRFVGEPVAIVVTELSSQGEDAAEQVTHRPVALAEFVDVLGHRVVDLLRMLRCSRPAGPNPTASPGVRTERGPVCRLSSGLKVVSPARIRAVRS